MLNKFNQTGCHSRSESFLGGLVVGVLVLGFGAQAQGPAPDLSGVELPPVAVFTRCYRAITRLEPSVDHARLMEVSEGRDPIDACLDVLDQASLFPSEAEPSGARRLEPVYRDGSLAAQEARAVLDTFADHFRSWFTFKNWDDVPQVYSDYQGLKESLDINEESLHLLRALFQGGGVGQGAQSFSEIVLGAESLMAIRTHPTRLWNSDCRNYLDNTPVNCALSLPEWGNHGGASTSPGVGELLGIRVFPQGDTTLYSKNGTQFVTGPGNPISDFNPRANSGGISGLRSFLAKTGQYTNEANGGVSARRRWMKEVFESLLCRNLPVLRHEDVASLVAEFNALPDPANSPQAKGRLPFRQETSCMKCHAAIDGGAAVARGYRIFGMGGKIDFDSSGEATATGEDRVIMTFLRNPTMAASAIPLHLQLETDSNFKNRVPTGRLFYRSYDGTLVDIALDPSQAGDANKTEWTGDDGLAALAKHLSQSKDLYVCAASRMIEHFTGVKVNLSDPGDPFSPEFSSQDLMFRDWAEFLALDNESGLKSTQSLRTMIETLLRSDLYRSNGFRTAGGI